jgi:electron transport complex protein RnfG
VEAKALGFGGELKVLVGFDANGNIYNYSLLQHAETPGLGSKAADWFKPKHSESAKGIVGLSPGQAPLKVSKDGGQIDAITASTITSRAFLNAINAAYEAYRGGETTDANSGATAQITQEETL